MILHTIIPYDVVFNEQHNDTYTHTINWKDIKLEVKKLSGHTYEINRIIGTNPKHYLDPSLQPGMQMKVYFIPKG